MAVAAKKCRSGDNLEALERKPRKISLIVLPREVEKIMTADAQSIHLAQVAARAAAEKLATDIVVMDVSQYMPIVDCFVLASADNERQVSAIMDEVEDALREEGAKPKSRQGVRESRWILLDFGDIVVHIMRNQEREYYGLDRLWADAELIPVEGVESVERDELWVESAAAARNAQSIDEIPLATGEPDEDEI